MFLDSAEKVLNLPDPSTIIESEAFSGLSNLDIIVLLGDVSEIDDTAFAETNAVLIVAAGSYAENGHRITNTILQPLMCIYYKQ